MGDEDKIHKKRGRPVGHRLSAYTKDKIRQSRLGTRHSKETKDKISRSLEKYFKKRDSLSDSMGYEYSYVSKEAVKWVNDNKEVIDGIEDVLTEKRLSYLSQVELCFGTDIENLFGHNTTPEFLLILKEEITEAFGKEGLAELYSLL